MPQFDLESAPNYQIMKNVHQAKHYNHDSCEIKEMLLVKNTILYRFDKWLAGGNAFNMSEWCLLIRPANINLTMSQLDFELQTIQGQLQPCQLSFSNFILAGKHTESLM